MGLLETQYHLALFFMLVYIINGINVHEVYDRVAVYSRLASD